MRAVVDVFAPVLVPGSESGELFTIEVTRAPDGASVHVDGAEVTVSRAGAYRVAFVTETSRRAYDFVAIHPELLELPGLGADPRLTLRSIANHPSESGISDERWDACHESEHSNPLYGCNFTTFGGERIAMDPNNANAAPPARNWSFAPKGQ